MTRAGQNAAVVHSPSEQPNIETNTQSYRVQSGDCLWSIASRLVGPHATAAQVARLVDRLWELNRDRIGTGRPDLIYAGTQLRLR